MYKDKTKQMLKKLGVSVKLTGYEYLVDLISLVAKDPRAIKGICTKLYADVADKYNVTAGSVERSIRSAIDSSFNTMGAEEIYKLFGNTLSLYSARPTNAQYVATVAEAVRDAG